mgnify:CR=1 FL=1
MNRVAFIRENGRVNHSFFPDNQDTYTPGQVVDGLSAQFFNYEENPINWIDTKYWNFSTSQWETLPEKPEGTYHEWGGPDNYSWVFRQDLLLSLLRSQRNQKLIASDWTQIADADLTSEQVTEARTYRTSLRDLPSTWASITAESDVTWPTPPSFIA